MFGKVEDSSFIMLHEIAMPIRAIQNPLYVMGSGLIHSPERMTWCRDKSVLRVSRTVISNSFYVDPNPKITGCL